MMDCRQVESLLDDFLAESLEQGDRFAIESHLLECESCKELLSILSREMVSSDLAPPPGLAQTVLEKTSGSACQSATPQLTSLVDDELLGTERELVIEHLKSCKNCRAIEVALRQMAVDFPGITDQTPRPAFTARVMVRTVDKPSKQAQLADLFRRIVFRPRFSLEVAYVCMVFIVLVLGPEFVGKFGQQAGKLARTASSDQLASLDMPIKTPVANATKLTESTFDQAAGMLGAGLETGRYFFKNKQETVVSYSEKLGARIEARWSDLAGKWTQPNSIRQRRDTPEPSDNHPHQPSKQEI